MDGNCRARLVFDDSLTEYAFGPSHPMNPIRVDLTVRLARMLGVVGERGVPLVAAPQASEDDLLRVHTPAYVDAVLRGVVDERFGLGTDDNPVFPNMHEASRHVVGASLEAARQVWSGEVDHAANIVGGLHHAMPGKASGFCIYNDVALAIDWLLRNGARRVAYVDIDAHHGDGVERIFRDDPRVLTISIHETGRMLFPGTGYASDIGGPDALGSSANIALPPGTRDAGWLRAFHAVVPPLVTEFAPDILVTQHGCDSHAVDPLTHLELSVDGQRAAHLALHDLSHKVAGGRWLAFGGGGYAIVDVVPRTWTHLLAALGNRPLDPETPVPADWLGYVRERYQVNPPALLGDGRPTSYKPWNEGYDPDQWLDRAVNSTREAVFPLHGLDPLP